MYDAECRNGMILASGIRIDHIFHKFKLMTRQCYLIPTTVRAKKILKTTIRLIKLYKTEFYDSLDKNSTADLMNRQSKKEVMFSFRKAHNSKGLAELGRRWRIEMLLKRIVKRS